MYVGDNTYVLPQGLTRIQVIESSADAWTQEGAAYTNHKQDGNIRTKDLYPDGANCMRIRWREAIGAGDKAYALPLWKPAHENFAYAKGPAQVIALTRYHITNNDKYSDERKLFQNHKLYEKKGDFNYVWNYWIYR